MFNAISLDTGTTALKYISTFSVRHCVTLCGLDSLAPMCHVTVLVGWPISEMLLWCSFSHKNYADVIPGQRPGVRRSSQKSMHCILNCLFRCRSKKTQKLRVSGLCEENSPVTSEFPAQKASNKERCFHLVTLSGLLPYNSHIATEPFNFQSCRHIFFRGIWPVDTLWKH